MRGGGRGRGGAWVSGAAARRPAREQLPPGSPSRSLRRRPPLPWRSVGCCVPVALVAISQTIKRFQNAWPRCNPSESSSPTAVLLPLPLPPCLFPQQACSLPSHLFGPLPRPAGAAFGGGEGSKEAERQLLALAAEVLGCLVSETSFQSDPLFTTHLSRTLSSLPFLLTLSLLKCSLPPSLLLRCAAAPAPCPRMSTRRSPPSCTSSSRSAC